jgi:uncharacterized protein (TIGR01777 family)
MDVVISGAGGLIGTALTNALEQAGHQVRRLQRGGVTGGDRIGWDPDAGLIDAPAFEGVDAVVNLAGAPIGEKRWTTEQKYRILQTRTRGTAAIAGAIASRERRPRVFVSGSAVGFYGSRHDEVLTESSTRGHDFLAEVVEAWENETQPAIDAGIRTVMIRTGIVLAEHGGALKALLTPFKLGVGGRQGSGQQWMSWITLEDEVNAILHAIDTEALEGPVNFVAPNPVMNADFAKALGEALHRPAVLPTPLFVLKARYGAELVESLLLASQRVAPVRLEASGYGFRHPTLDDALRSVLRR